MSENLRQELSALLDGELDSDRVDQVLDALARDPDLQHDWACWLGQGDRLRGEPPVSAGFMARFSERLAAEPVVLAPRRSRWSRKLLPLALAASVSFVVVSAWQMHWFAVGAQPVAQIEREEKALRAYLAAHLEDAGNPLAEQTVVAVAFESGENR